MISQIYIYLKTWGNISYNDPCCIGHRNISLCRLLIFRQDGNGQCFEWCRRHLFSSRNANVLYLVRSSNQLKISIRFYSNRWESHPEIQSIIRRTLPGDMTFDSLTVFIIKLPVTCICNWAAARNFVLVSRNEHL